MDRTYAPSGNVARLRESATIAVSQKARALKAAGHRVIDLGAGEPDFETPGFIRRAAQRALDEGATKYTAVEGILPLRQAIAARAAELTPTGGSIDPRDVVVTTGSKQALFNACFVLFGPGDEVLVPTPAWTSYYEMIELARAQPVQVGGDPEHSLKVSADDLSRACTPHSRGVVLNSPSNPTGAVYSQDELGAIVRFAAERGLWVISDEIYRQIAYDGEATSVLSVAEARDNLVVVDGMAKAYAMTGWRVGWGIAPSRVAATMTALQSHTTSNATTVAQHAALAGLTERDEAQRAIGRMVAEYRRRRDAALAILREVPELQFVRPEGAFYLFLFVGETMSRGNAGSAFAARLLDDEGVAVVPGSAFHAPDWIRVSYAAAESEVVEGVRRVVRLWNALRNSALTTP
jgi:aspartate aminotransferase